MTAEEKAKELLDKMNVVHYMKLTGENSNSEGLPISMYDSQIKQCALIAVDEILKVLRYFNEENAYREDITKAYWHKVKTEIEKPWKQHKTSSKTTIRN